LRNSWQLAHDIEPFLDHPYAQMRTCVGAIMATLARVSWDPAFTGTPRVESTHSATHAAAHTAVACTPGVESTLSSPALAALGTHATQSDGDASSRAASSCASLFVPPRWALSASLHDPMPLRCGGTTHCNTLQHTTHCNTLQHTATHCNTLQLTATHYTHAGAHAALRCSTCG